MTKKLVYQSQVAASATSLGVVAQTTSIHAAVVTNTSAASRTLQVWLLSDASGSATDANKIYDNLTVDADTSLSLSLLVNHVIPSGGALFMQADAATSLTVTVSGC